MTTLIVRAIGLAAIVASLAAPALAQSNDPYNREVLIYNATGSDIVEFYASNTGTESWEENILGGGVIPAGEAATIYIDDGSGYCKYDFYTVFDDGAEVVTPDNNVCELAEFTIYE